MRSNLVVLVAAAVATVLYSQGPGSCGFHLDLVTNDTSTHSAIADVPGAPGAQPGGLAPGSPGNPYSAYATPGSLVRARIQVPPSNLGNFAATTPYGAGSIISLLYAVGAPNLNIPPVPGGLAPCSHPSWVISILPLTGSLIDGLGVLAPASAFPAADPGFPGSFEITFPYPFGAPPVNLQAVLIEPGGSLAVSNGVSLLAGPSPHETSISFAPPTACIWAPGDEGVGSFGPPPGFEFYGVITGTAAARPNGLIEFGPAAGSGCPYDQWGDFGCTVGATEVTPRVAVNIVDSDLNVLPVPGYVNDVTYESAPATASTPTRVIIRYKNVSPWFSVPGNAILTDSWSATCELWGNDVPVGSPAAGKSIVVVRQQFKVGLYNDVYGAVGISPGLAGQGFGGPPPTCHDVDIPFTWGGWYFTTGPSEAVRNFFFTSGSALLSHLAVRFSPTPGAGYQVEAY
jgi:hypothetical protein